MRLWKVKYLVLYVEEIVKIIVSLKSKLVTFYCQIHNILYDIEEQNVIV